MIMLNKGVPKGKIAKEIEKKAGLSEKYVRELLPRRFKMPARSKAAEERWQREKKAADRRHPSKKNLYGSTMQNLSGFHERSPIQPSFKEHLNGATEKSTSKKASKATDIFRCKCHRSYRVDWKARRIEEFEGDPYAPLDRMLQYYSQEFIDYVNLRVGEITRDDEKAGSYDFMKKAVRKFLEILWREVSGDRFLLDAAEEDFKVALKEL